MNTRWVSTRAGSNSRSANQSSAGFLSMVDLPENCNSFNRAYESSGMTRPPSSTGNPARLSVFFVSAIAWMAANASIIVKKIFFMPPPEPRGPWIVCGRV